MPLSTDVRLQYSQGLAKGSCVLQLNAFIVRCSPSVVAGFARGSCVLQFYAFIVGCTCSEVAGFCQRRLVFYSFVPSSSDVRLK